MRLKPFHVGSREDHRFLINIEDMETRPIDERTARFLGQMADGGDAFSGSQNREPLNTLGLLSNKGKAAVREAPKNPPPIVNGAFFLTQSCNLRCVYCYGAGGEYGHKGSMTEKTAFQAVDWLMEQSGKMKQIRIGFFGGEPFLNFPLMQKIASYALKKTRALQKEVCFYATTNGTLLEKEQIDFIQAHNIRVMISFDGPKAIQDAQRPFAGGKGSYDAIVPRIKELLAIRPQTPGHAVLMGDTDPRVVKEALEEIGFADVSITPASECMLTCDKNMPNAKRNVGNILNALEEEADTWLERIEAKDVRALKALKKSSGLHNGLLAFAHNRKRIYPCGAGLGFAGISNAGDVYLCHRFVGMDAYKLGSVFDHHLDRDDYLKSPTSFVEACTDCPARYFCAGSCKYDNGANTGSVFTPPEEMCRLHRRGFELSAYLWSRMDGADRAFLRQEGIVPPKPCPLDF